MDPPPSHLVQEATLAFDYVPYTLTLRSAPGNSAHSPTLTLSACTHDGVWRGEFTAGEIERMSAKTGSFQPFATMERMLSRCIKEAGAEPHCIPWKHAAGFDTLCIDLLTYERLDQLKASRRNGEAVPAAAAAPPASTPRSAARRALNKRYLILSLSSDNHSERIHYPLPLLFQGPPTSVDLAASSSEALAAEANASPHHRPNGLASSSVRPLQQALEADATALRQQIANITHGIHSNSNGSQQPSSSSQQSSLQPTQQPSSQQLQQRRTPSQPKRLSHSASAIDAHAYQSSPQSRSRSRSRSRSPPRSRSRSRTPPSNRSQQSQHHASSSPSLPTAAAVAASTESRLAHFHRDQADSLSLENERLRAELEMLQSSPVAAMPASAVPKPYVSTAALYLSDSIDYTLDSSDDDDAGGEFTKHSVGHNSTGRDDEDLIGVSGPVGVGQHRRLMSSDDVQVAAAAAASRTIQASEAYIDSLKEQLAGATAAAKFDAEVSLARVAALEVENRALRRAETNARKIAQETKEALRTLTAECDRLRKQVQELEAAAATTSFSAATAATATPVSRPTAVRASSSSIVASAASPVRAAAARSRSNSPALIRSQSASSILSPSSSLPPLRQNSRSPARQQQQQQRHQQQQVASPYMQAQRERERVKERRRAAERSGRSSPAASLNGGGGGSRGASPAPSSGGSTPTRRGSGASSSLQMPPGHHRGAAVPPLAPLPGRGRSRSPALQGSGSASSSPSRGILSRSASASLSDRGPGSRTSSPGGSGAGGRFDPVAYVAGRRGIQAHKEAAMRARNEAEIARVTAAAPPPGHQHRLSSTSPSGRTMGSSSSTPSLAFVDSPGRAAISPESRPSGYVATSQRARSLRFPLDQTDPRSNSSQQQAHRHRAPEAQGDSDRSWRSSTSSRSPASDRSVASSAGPDYYSRTELTPSKSQPRAGRSQVAGRDRAARGDVSFSTPSFSSSSSSPSMRSSMRDLDDDEEFRELRARELQEQRETERALKRVLARAKVARAVDDAYLSSSLRALEPNVPRIDGLAEIDEATDDSPRTQTKQVHGLTARLAKLQHFLEAEKTN